MKNKEWIIIVAIIGLCAMFGTWSVKAKTYIADEGTWPYPISESAIIQIEEPASTPDPYPFPIPVTPPVFRSSLNVNFAYFIYLPAIFKPYNRQAAIAYADQYAHSRNSDYPNFGTGCECNDCTNYISQSINQGGIALKTGDWDENNVFEWWYRKGFLRFEYSKTWSATDWFNTYLFQYPNEFEFRNWPTELEGGDFFLMDLHGADLSDPPDGVPDHARFIVGLGYSSVNPEDYSCTVNPIPPSTFSLLANQHCVDRKHINWNYNIVGIGVWPFHVIDLPSSN